jgi:hypothetical protein
MDRIYSIYDCDVSTFKKWAASNGYITKYYQNAKSQNLFDIDNIPVTMNLRLKLDNHKFKTYPYLDTFQFYDILGGVFYNNQMMSYDCTLIQSDGGLYPPPDENDDDDFDFSDEYEDHDVEW